MPAALEEIEEAETEGILMPGRGPKRVHRPGRQSDGLEWCEPYRFSTRTGRFNPTFEENSESVIECDTVILAIGQAPRLDFLTAEDGVEISGRGLIDRSRPENTR
jgi:formate dehydrogenase (NADP+) beta subunit